MAATLGQLNYTTQNGCSACGAAAATLPQHSPSSCDSFEEFVSFPTNPVCSPNCLLGCVAQGAMGYQPRPQKTLFLATTPMPLAAVGGNGALANPSQEVFLKSGGHFNAGLLNARVLHQSFNKNKPTRCSGHPRRPRAPAQTQLSAVYGAQL